MIAFKARIKILELLRTTDYLGFSMAGFGQSALKEMSKYYHKPRNERLAQDNRHG